MALSKYLAVWGYILDIHLEFHEYFALNPSLYFTLISARLYKVIAESHLDFRCTEHRKLTESLGFLGRDLNSYCVRSDSVGVDSDL